MALISLSMWNLELIGDPKDHDLTPMYGLAMIVSISKRTTGKNINKKKLYISTRLQINEKQQTSFSGKQVLVNKLSDLVVIKNCIPKINVLEQSSQNIPDRKMNGLNTEKLY